MGSEFTEMEDIRGIQFQRVAGIYRNSSLREMAMDNRPNSLLVGNFVAVTEAPTDSVDWPSGIDKGGVRVGKITDLKNKDRYVVCADFALVCCD